LRKHSRVACELSIRLLITLFDRERLECIDHVAIAGPVIVIRTRLENVHTARSVSITIAIHPRERWSIAGVTRGAECVLVCFHNVKLGAEEAADLGRIAVLEAA